MSLATGCGLRNVHFRFEKKKKKKNKIKKYKHQKEAIKNFRCQKVSNTKRLGVSHTMAFITDQNTFRIFWTSRQASPRNLVVLPNMESLIIAFILRPYLLRLKMSF